MSVDLETQIRMIADAAFEETTAVDVDRSPVAVEGPPAETVTNQEDIMLKPNSDPSPSTRRTRLLAAAASVVLIIAGIVAIALLTGDSEQPPIDPSPTTVPTSVETTTPTTVASVDTEALAAVGEQLVAALSSRDRDAVADLVADTANPVSMLQTTTKADLIDLLGYLEAADLTFEVRECVGSEPDQVECTLLQRSGFSTASGVPPGAVTALMKVEDGQVVAMRFGRAEGHGRAHDLFSSFIRESDPDAPAKMWETDSSGVPWPLLTDEALELFERYTQEYLAARGFTTD